ncbi:MAG: DUF1127 domain-containing protein [Hyphomicrobiaceae bacterium]|nr:DUF1127 domain-containing protein [Hyphomicrobiaceae bacterium]
MAIVSSIMSYLRRELGYRVTRRQLHELDDRILQDIGLRRDEIDGLALNLREKARANHAAEAHNRRNEKAHKGGVGGGLAAQH